MSVTTKAPCDEPVNGFSCLSRKQIYQIAGLTINRDSQPGSSACLQEFDVENAARRVVNDRVEFNLKFNPVRGALEVLLLLEDRRRVSEDLADQLNVEVVQFVDGHDAVAFLNASGPVGD